MRKITDFVVNKRYIILIVFIIFSIISIILSTKVNINSDITKYLPKTSETRIGMDIMESQFPEEQNSSSFNFMIKGLSDEEKTKIYEELSNTKGVSSVTYNNTENYNKDDYTLYVINVDDNKKSELASDVYNEIIKKYENYETHASGDIWSSNTSILPFWILAVSIICAVIILIIMCESYVEPFLFLTAILMAVLLNSGTNIIFKSVSSITNSISAILQMALSMDYSIMLMNRFRQEKQNEEDKVKAMKNALYNAFKSISSSSLTTIVGLLSLIFMSFTIGKDLGLVLAKGVLLSLVTVFFVLPTLILAFDKLITKTKKKTLNIKLSKLGTFSYKLRYPLSILFIIVFVGCYFLKGNLKILYTASELDEISTVFGANNQIAVIYKNEDEKNVSLHLKEIEDSSKVTNVLAYSNTINEKLTYKELSSKLEMLGSNMSLDDYLLKILYYKYYNPNEEKVIKLENLNDFIQSKIYKNINITQNLDDETKQMINKIKYFTQSAEINKQRSSSEISTILGISKENIDNIFMYYNFINSNTEVSLSDFIKIINGNTSIDSNQTMSLKELINFVIENLLDNTNYFDENAKQKIMSINGLMEASLNNAKFTDDEIVIIVTNLSDTLDNKTKELIYTYYGSSNKYDETWKLTLEEFVDFLNQGILQDERLKCIITDEMENLIINGKNTLNKVKNSLVGEEYSRIVINTTLDLESQETFNFIENIKSSLENETSEIYVIGNSAMAYEMNETFAGEFNYISILTMIAIFIVVAITFKSIILPIILVLIIQCAVYTTMGYLSFTGGTVYFIAILIVQSILMGATIDYAIVYTSYYLENRKNLDIKNSIINAYNQSIHTILTSASILIIVTFIIGKFATAITSKICKTLAEGTLCSSILILLLLPSILAVCDKVFARKNK